MASGHLRCVSGGQHIRGVLLRSQRTAAASHWGWISPWEPPHWTVSWLLMTVHLHLQRLPHWVGPIPIRLKPCSSCSSRVPGIRLTHAPTNWHSISKSMSTTPIPHTPQLSSPLSTQPTRPLCFYPVASPSSNPPPPSLLLPPLPSTHAPPNAQACSPPFYVRTCPHTPSPLSPTQQIAKHVLAWQPPSPGSPASSTAGSSTTSKATLLRPLAEQLYARRPLLYLRGRPDPLPASVLLRSVVKPPVEALSRVGAAGSLFKAPANTLIVIKFDPQFGYAGGLRADGRPGRDCFLGGGACMLGMQAWVCVAGTCLQPFLRVVAGVQWLHAQAAGRGLWASCAWPKAHACAVHTCAVIALSEYSGSWFFLCVLLFILPLR